MLATLDQLKAELNISDASQDARLSLLLGASSDACEAYCQRRFGRSTQTELIAARGRQVINLQNYPVVSIDSVTLFSQAITDYQVDLESGQLWRLVAWPWSPMLLQQDITLDPDPNHADRNVRVTYTSGYILPGNEGANLPFSLQYAAIRLAAMQYLRPIGFKSEKTPGGYSYEAFDTTVEGMLSEVSAYLDPYKRRPIAI